MSDVNKIALEFQKKYGLDSASIGRFHRAIDVIPTGILALDYALGTGGWPGGTVIEVYGPPDAGKSSCLGFNAIIQAQKMGKLCGIVAVEPGFDPEWAEKNGVNLDELVITWPNDGQEAFEHLHDMVNHPDIELVLFDSIGALLRPSEVEVGGKPSQGGQSALITWGVKRVSMAAWKLNKTVIYLNQVRDDMHARVPGVLDSPGGWGLKHMAEIRVQLRPGMPIRHKIDGDDVIIGKEITAVIKRTKKDEGTGKKAVFTHYSAEVEGKPFGIDLAEDIINTGKRTGVIRAAGAWLYHSSFPEGQLQGKGKLAEFLSDKPEVVELIRMEIIEAMDANG